MGVSEDLVRIKSTLFVQKTLFCVPYMLFPISKKETAFDTGFFSSL